MEKSHDQWSQTKKSAHLATEARSRNCTSHALLVKKVLQEKASGPPVPITRHQGTMLDGEWLSSHDPLPGHSHSLVGFRVTPSRMGRWNTIPASSEEGGPLVFLTVVSCSSF